MEKEPNWAKHGAFAAYAALPIAIVGIGVMLWLGLRQPLQAASPATVTAPTGGPMVVPLWIAWCTASLYLVGVIGAALIQLKAARVRAHEVLAGTAVEGPNSVVQTKDKEIAQLQGLIDKSNNTVVERSKVDNIRSATRAFKKMAREIRKTWPNADFNKRPLYKNSWIPPVNYPVPSPWLNLATDWLNGVLKIPHVANATGLQSLDFDGVMELLDDADAAAEGVTFPELNPAQCPDVEIASWGSRDEGQPYIYGFRIYNRGQTATNVRLFPSVYLGRYKIRSSSISTLLDVHGQAFLEASLSEDENTYVEPSKLIEIVAEDVPINHSGFRLAPLVRLIYQTPNNSWIGSTHEMYVTTDKKSLAFRRVKHEVLLQHSTLPDLRDELQIG